MKYLLDTCIISYFVRGEPSILEKIKRTSPLDICVSSITIMEIEFGLALNPDRAKKIKTVINQLIDNTHTLPFLSEDARCAGLIRASLQQKGKTIGAYDVLLAGCAIHRGLTLITANTKEFSQVSGLSLENWR